MKRIFLSLSIAVLWTLNGLSVQANIGSSPVVNTAGEVLFVKAVDAGSELVKVNTTNPSTVLASSNINARIFSSPVLDVDGYLYVATLQNFDGQSTYTDASKVLKLDSAFIKVWEFDAGSSVYSTVAITPFNAGQSGQLFFGTKDGKVFSLNTNDGSKNWEIETGFEVGGNAVLWPLDNSLSIANGSGEIFFLDQATGAVKAQYTVPDRASVTTPVKAITLRFITIISL